MKTDDSPAPWLSVPCRQTAGDYQLTSDPDRVMSAQTDRRTGRPQLALSPSPQDVHGPVNETETVKSSVSTNRVKLKWRSTDQRRS